MVLLTQQDLNALEKSEIIRLFHYMQNELEQTRNYMKQFSSFYTMMNVENVNTKNSLGMQYSQNANNFYFTTPETNFFDCYPVESMFHQQKPDAYQFFDRDDYKDSNNVKLKTKDHQLEVS